MRYKEILEEVSKELDIDNKIVIDVYKHYWKSIKSYVQKLPFNRDLSEDEYKELRPHVYLPKLGKMHCTYKEFIGSRKKLKKIRDVKNNKD